MKLRPHDPDYPAALNECHRHAPELEVSGPLDTGPRVMAIVGARNAVPGAADFAHRLAYHLAKAGITIVSGGAEGVDRCAHEGARRAGGTTWVVACTSRNAEPYPLKHAELFDEIARDERSRMIWPFADLRKKDDESPRYRNTVLVGLAECVIVIQARDRSGSLNAANRGHEYRRPVYVVPGSPWDSRFAGSICSVVAGGQPLWSVESFFEQLGLPAPALDDPAAAWNGTRHTRTLGVRRQVRPEPIFERAISAADEASWTDEERRVFSCLSVAATQQDDIVAKTGLGLSSTLTALLTLSLKDVVVEGPDGFFRRRNAP